MTNESVSNDMRTVWQNQTLNPGRMSLRELRQKAQRLRKRALWRNLREYVAAAFVVAIFGYQFWKFQTPLLRIGSGVTIAGALYLIYQLHRRGSARTIPTAMALNTCLDFYRTELERQRDLLRNVWRWYLLPLVPGMILFLLGLFKFATEQPTLQSAHGLISLGLAVAAGVCAVVFVIVGKVNQLAARKLQRQIDALDVPRKEL